MENLEKDLRLGCRREVESSEYMCGDETKLDPGEAVLRLLVIISVALFFLQSN